MKFFKRLKRHKQNKYLLNFAENVFYTTQRSNYRLLVHPLIYEIIRFKHPEAIYPLLGVDSFAKDYYTITVF